MHWRSDPTFTPPGGESLAAAGARVRARARSCSPSPTVRLGVTDTVVVVSHVSPIKAAACWSLGMGDEGAWRLYLATASVTRITWGPGRSGAGRLQPHPLVVGPVDRSRTRPDRRRPQLSRRTAVKAMTRSADGAL